MKYYTEKESNEILALMTLANSDIQELSTFAKDALKKVETIGIEITIDKEVVIDERAIDDNSMLTGYVMVYDKHIASHLYASKDFEISITMINLLTCEIIFDGMYLIYNNGEGTSTREDCARKELREAI